MQTDWMILGFLAFLYLLYGEALHRAIRRRRAPSDAQLLKEYDQRLFGDRYRELK